MHNKEHPRSKIETNCTGSRIARANDKIFINIAGRPITKATNLKQDAKQREKASELEKRMVVKKKDRNCRRAELIERGERLLKSREVVRGAGKVGSSLVARSTASFTTTVGATASVGSIADVDGNDLL